VQALAQPGTYGPSTTYTILTANGGRTGTYNSVTSNFAFLTPSLTYDANNVFLTLALLQNNNTSSGGFLMSAFTPNQKAVATALNQSVASATGDYLTVINGLASLTAFQGPAALTALSGEQYADFGTMTSTTRRCSWGRSASRWRWRVARRAPRAASAPRWRWPATWPPAMA